MRFVELILLFLIYLVSFEGAQEDRCTTCTKIADRFQMVSTGIGTLKYK